MPKCGVIQQGPWPRGRCLWTLLWKFVAAPVRRLGCPAAVGAFALLAPATVWADSLTGRILDLQGNVVPGTQLILYDRTGGLVRQATSGADGRYAFNDIPAGEYVLEAQASGGSLSGSTVTTLSGDLALDLTLAISGMAAEVVVTASSTPFSTPMRTVSSAPVGGRSPGCAFATERRLQHDPEGEAGPCEQW